MNPVLHPAVFLDRDGTINVEKNYLHTIEEWEWIPGAIQGLATLKAAGFLLIVVSNQSGIARNYYSSEAVDHLHSTINAQLQGDNAAIDAFYYCPHHPEFSGQCECRKPAPDMLFLAAKEHQIDLSRSWMIGDKTSDIEAGLNAGCNSILVLTGYGAKAVIPRDIPRLADLQKAAQYILSHTNLSSES